jgi:hypothetical protein
LLPCVVIMTWSAIQRIISLITSGVFTEVTMKNAVLWDVTPRGSC